MKTFPIPVWLMVAFVLPVSLSTGVAIALLEDLGMRVMMRPSTADRELVVSQHFPMMVIITWLSVIAFISGIVYAAIQWATQNSAKD